MSSRNRHSPCHKKTPTCTSKKAKNKCQLPCSDDPCAPHPLRQHFSDAFLRCIGPLDGSGAPKNFECEIERLVDCARQWSEKEKFKLKQFYEEEMCRRKQQVIHEFKCAMDRDVVAPLKCKLCECEKEIYNLKSQLERASRNGGGVRCPEVSDFQNNRSPGVGVGGASPGFLDLGVVDEAIEKARKSNRQLQTVINSEKKRKKSRSLDVGGGGGGVQQENMMGEELTPLMEVATEEDVAITGDVIDKLLQTPDLNDDTRAVISKVRDLTNAIVETKNFTEEEIADLIKESELSEGFKKQARDLMVENGRLLKQLEALKPGEGSVEEENMLLRQRLQELEGQRTRGSLQSELTLLKTQSSTSPERIAELEDSLDAMTELEVRLKELEEQSKEMEGLKKKMKAMQNELEELRGKDCPVCPVASETELNALKKKLEEAEAFLEKKAKEFNNLNDKLKDVQKVNEELSSSVASFKAVEKKHEELEALHAQVLEEKRRKSLEARELGQKVGKLEADYLKALKDLDKVKEDLTNAEERAREGDKVRRNLEAEVEGLKRDVEGLKRTIDENNNNIEDLKRRLKDKEGELEDLKIQSKGLREELDGVRRKMEEALKEKERLDKELETLRRHCEQVQNDLMNKLKEQQKRCSEACDALSKRGMCILEHEKKCLNVTSQMERDNDDLRGKLRQMQEQLDAMASMEQVTRALHGQMEEFHKRAQERGRELEELKRLPETCDLKNMKSDALLLNSSSMYSLPSLPISSTTSGGGLGGGTRSDQCNTIQGQLRDLQRAKEEMDQELEGRLRAVEEINRQLEELQKKDRMLKDEKDRKCRD